MWKLDRIRVAISHQNTDMIPPQCPGQFIPQQEVIYSRSRYPGSSSSSMLTKRLALLRDVSLAPQCVCLFQSPNLDDYIHKG